MRPLVKAVLAGLVVLLFAGCVSPDPEPFPDLTPSETPTPTPTPAEPVSVKLDLPETLSQPVVIGLLVPPVEGESSEYRPFVEGAGVAISRFALSGAAVSLVTALDDGTSTGAAAAMDSLVDAGAAGVIMAACGPHTDEALEIASAAGLAVVMPYGHPSGPTAGVWSSAPTAAQLAATLAAGLAEARVRQPVLIATDARLVGPQVKPVVQLNPDDPGAAVAVAMLVRDLLADSVIIDAPASQQAAIVVGLQAELGDLQVPVFLGPQALTPAFSQALIEGDASNAWLVSAGLDTDLSSLTHGGQADAAAAFYAALRLGANNPACRNIYDDDNCASAATWADIASHDAVVALVRAVERAGSTTPSEVGQALAGLALTGADGLAGPDLDFTSAETLPGSAVVVLHSTAVNPGVRPTSDPRLYWFPGRP